MLDTLYYCAGAAGRNDRPQRPSYKSLVSKPSLQGTQEGEGRCSYNQKGQSVGQASFPPSLFFTFHSILLFLCIF